METKRPRIIFTESPEEEMWRYLSGFMYVPNIERYLSDNGLQASIEKAEEISTFFLQAQEYFNAARISSMQISPLLLYYGTVNLYSALRSLRGQDSVSISNHGMRDFIPDESKKMGDIQVDVLNNPQGGFQQYLELFQDGNHLSNIRRWKLSDILSSLPDLYDDYISSSMYKKDDVHLIPIDVDLNGKDEVHRIRENVNRILPNDIDMASEVIRYNDAYLRPNKLQDGSLVLRLRIDAEDITVRSLSGVRYLRRYVSYEDKKGFISSEIGYLMSLYVLGVVSRYKPSIWNPFASRDVTGERRIIERFLLISRRVIPNLAINFIEDRSVIFTNQQYSARNPTPLTVDEVKEIVREAMKSRGAQ